MNARKMRQQFERAFTPVCPPAGGDPEAWLQERVEFYAKESARLQAELKHAQVLLRGHQTWLQDIQRRKAGS